MVRKKSKILKYRRKSKSK